jgi:hypothetical protein
MYRDIIDRVHNAYIEVTGPVAIWCARHNMPVVVRLKINKNRRLAGRVDDIG